MQHPKKVTREMVTANNSIDNDIVDNCWLKGVADGAYVIIPDIKGTDVTVMSASVEIFKATAAALMLAISAPEVAVLWISAIREFSVIDEGSKNKVKLTNIPGVKVVASIRIGPRCCCLEFADTLVMTTQSTQSLSALDIPLRIAV